MFGAIVFLDQQIELAHEVKAAISDEGGSKLLRFRQPRDGDDEPDQQDPQHLALNVVSVLKLV